MTADQKALLVTALILAAGSYVLFRLVNKFTAWIEARSDRRPLVIVAASPSVSLPLDDGRQSERLSAAHICSTADAPRIAAGLRSLVTVGLRPRTGVAERFDEIAEDIAAGIVGINYSRKPTQGDFALTALQGVGEGENSPFENAVFYEDHGFDVANMTDYVDMISDIVSLAGEEWPVRRVVVANAHDPSAAELDIGAPYRVTIDATPPVTPFELTEGKDFDWSLIFRLNERLPSSAKGRFAILLDGNATIVFLPPEKIDQLNALCGYEFFYEDTAQ